MRYSIELVRFATGSGKKLCIQEIDGINFLYLNGKWGFGMMTENDDDWLFKDKKEIIRAGLCKRTPHFPAVLLQNREFSCRTPANRCDRQNGRQRFPCQVQSGMAFAFVDPPHVAGYQAGSFCLPAVKCKNPGTGG